MATQIKRRELFTKLAGIGASPASAQACTGASLIPNVALRTHEGSPHTERRTLAMFWRSVLGPR